MNKSQNYMYSTSVPISVPLWGRREITPDEDDVGHMCHDIFYIVILSVPNHISFDITFRLFRAHPSQFLF